jgi:peroxiredoxin
MIAILLLLILLSICVGFYQLATQQGRILLRLDALERGATTVDHDSFERHEQVVFEGLPSGAIFPGFELPDLSGKTRTLADFKGKRLLLIHWNFECGFCETIADDLAGHEADFEKQNIQIVLLAAGDEPFNRERIAGHGLKAVLLLLKQQQIPEPFAHQGTPVAYFLDERGRVAAPFASGADEVLALARRIAGPAAEPTQLKHERLGLTSERSLAESRIERNGLKAGARAPSFHLPDLRGHTVSLDDYRGQRVLLVFSDPNCGPCDELAPHLVRVHQEHRSNGLAILLVGRGSKEENRSKAEQFGFQFPVVVQDKWKLSKEYGIFATPVAFLIAENGVIAKDVAVGKDAILALAGNAATSEERAERDELIFDDVSRAIAIPLPRREILAKVGVALAGALLAALGLQTAGYGQESPEGNKGCPKGKTRCGDKCCESGLICCNGKCCTSSKDVCLKGGCCESERVCAGKCCASKEICLKGDCCESDRVCAGKCCASKEVCLKSGCCESDRVCAGKCCNETESCIKGVCRKVISPISSG